MQTTQLRKHMGEFHNCHQGTHKTVFSPIKTYNTFLNPNVLLILKLRQGRLSKKLNIDYVSPYDFRIHIFNISSQPCHLNQKLDNFIQIKLLCKISRTHAICINLITIIVLTLNTTSQMIQINKFHEKE